MPWLYFNGGTSSRWVDPAENHQLAAGEAMFDDTPDTEQLTAAFPGHAAALAAQQAGRDNMPVIAELAEMDRFLPRGLEDDWAVSGFDVGKLPKVQRDRLARKAALRALLAG